MRYNFVADSFHRKKLSLVGKRLVDFLFVLGVKAEALRANIG